MNDDDSESRHSDQDQFMKYHPTGWVERYSRVFTIWVRKNWYWLKFAVWISVASFGVLVLAPAVLAIMI